MNANPAVSLSREVAAAIHAAFEDYNDAFRVITLRAQRRFQEREWQLGARDAVERIELYERCVEKCLASLVSRMGRHVADESAWIDTRFAYGQLIEDCLDREFYKTFFNSLTRKIFGTVGVNDAVEFIALDLEPTLDAGTVPTRNFTPGGDLPGCLAHVLDGLPWSSLFADIAAAAARIDAEIHGFLAARGLARQIVEIEMLEPVFYRGTRAFLVGRMSGSEWTLPLVIACRHDAEGVTVDAVMMSEYEVRPLFGFSRSYFHVDLATVGAAIRFLRTIMPGKATDELYTVLGRARQGKTERYRTLFRHLQHSSDLFTHAEGERGMVMIVFTLESLDIVFKIIRDRFAYPKTATREEVMEKYQFVFRHDRVGRLVDAQEFRRLRFPKDRFAPALLEELLAEAALTCRIEGDDLIVEHCYLERRMKPLNIYLQEAGQQAARRAIRDYGQAIRDLALSNVFPGDLLLKNFGVSRHGRVIFYDYDELCLVTECSFRDLPAPRDDEEEMRAEPWFYVSPTDVFPAQWLKFLGIREPLCEEFLKHHAEILTADWWRRLKANHEAEKHVEVIPYTARTSRHAVI
ncbi:MAG: bifunctional isocitrate dehydrogenase kinase/phosphatase, partial [Gammaproteobacteria bacterium]|nr:bifunctional isocitrate dehydrogenase kinase/phosphatase [Gammaproteobacteria bacterium]